MPKVLVVDDEEDHIRLLCFDLEEAGYEVVTASNGRDALRKLLKDGPRIVLTDLMMPKMSGLELCRAVRESDATAFTYIIMLTACADRDRLLEAFEAGADDFLPKPFDQLELIARLKAGERIVSLESELARERIALHQTNAELRVLNERLLDLASTDELTGLGNRREALHHLHTAWQHARRHGQRLACLSLDIDHFKQCNDRFGHDAGDAVLREAGKVLRKYTRAGERPYRFGGEEFLVICPDATVTSATEGAERLRREIAAMSVEHQGRSLSVTISIGVAASDPDMEEPEDLLRHADSALYQAKEAGRNRVHLAARVVQGQPI